MAACRSSSENELKLILNNNSPQAHMESEFDVLGVPGKLVKYVVHSSKRKNRFLFFFLVQTAQTERIFMG
jgi:hypothetical protein